jgi:hypothetical protein
VTLYPQPGPPRPRPRHRQPRDRRLFALLLLTSLLGSSACLVGAVLAVGYRLLF